MSDKNVIAVAMFLIGVLIIGVIYMNEAMGYPL